MNWSCAGTDCASDSDHSATDGLAAARSTQLMAINATGPAAPSFKRSRLGGAIMPTSVFQVLDNHEHHVASLASMAVRIQSCNKASVAASCTRCLSSLLA
jgi:hypothetical protein